MKKSENKINKIFTLVNTLHLSSHEISDIFGDYNKEDLCIGKKNYSIFNSLNYFKLL